MTIEITSPEVQTLLRQRMEAGGFQTAEDLIREVLLSSPQESRTGAALIQALQACPFPEVGFEVAQVPSPLTRDIDW
jgi:hypothetical protein